MNKAFRQFFLIQILLISFILSYNVVLLASTEKPAQNGEHKLYTAKNSSEANMKFSHWVEMQSMRPPTTEMIREQIERQLTHLFGPMSNHPYPAVPRGDHKLRIYKPRLIAEATYRISYNYSGTIVLKNGPSQFYEVLLPNNPDEIYQKGFSGEINPCTDEHYQSEGDFWYFWNPFQKDCPLKEKNDFSRIKAEIVRKENETISFPDYARLVRPTKNQTYEIPIRIFLGMDDPTNLQNPNQSKDVNARTFLSIRDFLISNNYNKSDLDLSSHPDLQNIIRNRMGYLEEFRKTLNSKGRRIEIAIELYFGPTGIQENSKVFHYLFKNSIEAGSVLIYDGHSGLGGHLNIENIESIEKFKIQFDQNQYQIFYFNSCSSYPYYNTMYFEQKKSALDPKGTLNLDILTNGLSTYFSVLDRSSLSLITAIEYWASGEAMISYQQLAKKIDSGNLFGINGDEDNPKTP